MRCLFAEQVDRQIFYNILRFYQNYIKGFNSKDMLADFKALIK